MQSLLRIVCTVPLRFGMTAALALTAPALGAAGDEQPGAETTTSSSATTSESGPSTAIAPPGSVTDFLTFDAEPDAAAARGDGSALVSASVPGARNASENAAASNDEK